MILLSKFAAHTNRTDNVPVSLQRNTPTTNHDLAVVGLVDLKN